MGAIAKDISHHTYRVTLTSN